MILILCDRCSDRLSIYGDRVTVATTDHADPDRGRRDHHLCRSCYRDLRDWLNTPARPLGGDGASPEPAGAGRG